MANHDISWVAGAHMRFGSLDFIITGRGDLAWSHAAIQSLPSNGHYHERLGRQLDVSHGPWESREKQHRLANGDSMARPSGERHLSPERHVRSAPTALPFGLRNAAATASHLLALRMVLTPADNEFMGVIEHDTESLHKLLAEELESSSSSDSSRGSHHPSQECFMMGTPKGHVKSVHEGEATPTNDLNDEAERETVAPPCMPVEQLKARHQEIEEA